MDKIHQSQENQEAPNQQIGLNPIGHNPNGDHPPVENPNQNAANHHPRVMDLHRLQADANEHLRQQNNQEDQGPLLRTMPPPLLLLESQEWVLEDTQTMDIEALQETEVGGGTSGNEDSDSDAGLGKRVKPNEDSSSKNEVQDTLEKRVKIKKAKKEKKKQKKEKNKAKDKKCAGIMNEVFGLMPDGYKKTDWQDKLAKNKASEEKKNLGKKKKKKTLGHFPLLQELLGCSKSKSDIKLELDNFINSWAMAPSDDPDGKVLAKVLELVKSWNEELTGVHRISKRLSAGNINKNSQDNSGCGRYNNFYNDMKSRLNAEMDETVGTDIFSLYLNKKAKGKVPQTAEAIKAEISQLADAIDKEEISVENTDNFELLRILNTGKRVIRRYYPGTEFRTEPVDNRTMENIGNLPDLNRMLIQFKPSEEIEVRQFYKKEKTKAGIQASGKIQFFKVDKEEEIINARDWIKSYLTANYSLSKVEEKYHSTGECNDTAAIKTFHKKHVGAFLLRRQWNKAFPGKKIDEKSSRLVIKHGKPPTETDDNAQKEELDDLDENKMALEEIPQNNSTNDQQPDHETKNQKVRRKANSIKGNGHGLDRAISPSRLPKDGKKADQFEPSNVKNELIENYGFQMVTTPMEYAQYIRSYTTITDEKKTDDEQYPYIAVVIQGEIFGLIKNKFGKDLIFEMFGKGGGVNTWEAVCKKMFDTNPQRTVCETFRYLQNCLYGDWPKTDSPEMEALAIMLHDAKYSIMDLRNTLSFAVEGNSFYKKKEKGLSKEYDPKKPCSKFEPFWKMFGHCYPYVASGGRSIFKKSREEKNENTTSEQNNDRFEPSVFDNQGNLRPGVLEKGGKAYLNGLENSGWLGLTELRILSRILNVDFGIDGPQSGWKNFDAGGGGNCMILSLRKAMILSQLGSRNTIQTIPSVGDLRKILIEELGNSRDEIESALQDKIVLNNLGIIIPHTGDELNAFLNKVSRSVQREEEGPTTQIAPNQGITAGGDRATNGLGLGGGTVDYVKLCKTEVHYTVQYELEKLNSARVTNGLNPLSETKIKGILKNENMNLASHINESNN